MGAWELYSRPSACLLDRLRRVMPDASFMLQRDARRAQARAMGQSPYALDAFDDDHYLVMTVPSKAGPYILYTLAQNRFGDTELDYSVQCAVGVWRAREGMADTQTAHVDRKRMLSMGVRAPTWSRTAFDRTPRSPDHRDAIFFELRRSDWGGLSEGDVKRIGVGRTYAESVMRMQSYASTCETSVNDESALSISDRMKKPVFHSHARARV